jgi:hypothetical protein
MNKLSNHVRINTLLGEMSSARYDSEKYYEIQEKLRNFLDKQEEKIWNDGWKEGFFFHKKGWGYYPRNNPELTMWAEERMEEKYDGKSVYISSVE